MCALFGILRITRTGGPLIFEMEYICFANYGERCSL